MGIDEPIDLTRWSVGLKMDPTIKLEIGYQHAVHLEDFRSFSHYTIRFQAPLFLLTQFDSYQLESEAEFHLNRKSNRYLALRLGGGLSQNSNISGDFTSVYTRANFLPTLDIGGIGLAFNLGYQQTLLTKISHSAIVLDHFEDRYPTDESNSSSLETPHQGWYAGSALKFNAGLETAVPIAKSGRLRVSAGYLYHPNKFKLKMFGDIGLIPCYVNLDLQHSFDRRGKSMGVKWLKPIFSKRKEG